MKLLYTWVQEYKSFKNEGFNFSSKHKFEFDYDTFTLKYSQNYEFIDEFFSKELDVYTKDKSSKKDENKDDKKGKINDLTVIVGNNGSGKTTLLEMIFAKFIEDKYESELDVITCFEDNEKIKVYCKINKELYLETDDKNKEIFEIKKNYDSNKYIIINNHDKTNEFYEFELKENLNFIYYSNTFDNRYCVGTKKDKRDNTYDISTNGLLRKEKLNGVYDNKISLDKDPIINFFQNDFYRQIQFIYDFQESKNYIDFNLPSFATVRFNNLYEVIELIYNRLYSEYDQTLEYSELRKHIENELVEYQLQHGNEYLDKNVKYLGLKLLSLIMNVNKKLDDFVDDRYKLGGIIDNKKDSCIIGIKIIQGTFLNFLYGYILTGIKARDSLYKKMIANIENCINKKIRSKSNINDLFNFIKDFTWLMFEGHEISDKQINYIKSIAKFQSWINTNPIEIINLGLLCDEFSLRVNNNSNEDMNSLENFYQVYRETAKYFNYLEFSWPVSTGEFNMISLFARFYSLIDKENKLLIKLDEEAKYNKNEAIRQDIIILIDEADMTFHPEWQQKYIKKLLNFLQIAYKKYNIQLIISTHSPIMLSDIPNDNVIFLYKGNGKDKNSEVKGMQIKTFGSNIYNLYKQGFFLKKNNFGILGDFATSKIDDIQKILLDCSDKIDEVEDVLIEKQKKAKENGHKISKDKLDNDKITLLKKIRKEAMRDLKYCKKVINIIGEEFIRDMILEQYNEIYKRLEVKNGKIKDIKIEEIKNKFQQLSEEEQNEIIKYIIKIRKK